MHFKFVWKWTHNPSQSYWQQQLERSRLSSFLLCIVLTHIWILRTSKLPTCLLLQRCSHSLMIDDDGGTWLVKVCLVFTYCFFSLASFFLMTQSKMPCVIHNIILASSEEQVIFIMSRYAETLELKDGVLELFAFSSASQRFFNNFMLARV